MPPTGFVTHRACLEHDTGPGHPERASRLSAVLERVEREELFAALDRLEAEEADTARIAATHSEDFVHHVRAVCERGPTRIDGTDTAVSPESFRAALLAAGGVLQAVERVNDGAWKNAFVAVRPPGHHAEKGEAMGFCLFNNVAVAARALRDRHGRGRVAILDWDVHHGNGTQHIFERDASVYYASLHQWPLYPGTGAAEERGVGEGEGATLNCPQPPGSGDADWLRALETRILPALEEFRPDFVLISAGFDAHRLDPLAGCDLSAEGYREMTRLLTGFAAGACGGRLVSVLEGGYHLDALADSTQAHLEALMEASG